MSYDDKEKQWWEEHKDEVDPVIEDEINGEEVISLNDVVGTKDEPSYNPFN